MMDIYWEGQKAGKVDDITWDLLEASPEFEELFGEFLRDGVAIRVPVLGAKPPKGTILDGEAVVRDIYAFASVIQDLGYEVRRS